VRAKVMMPSGFAGDAATSGGFWRRFATSYIAATIVPTDAATPTSVAKNAHASPTRSEEHTSELQSRFDLVCRLLLEKKNNQPDRLFLAAHNAAAPLRRHSTATILYQADNHAPSLAVYLPTPHRPALYFVSDSTLIDS